MLLEDMADRLAEQKEMGVMHVIIDLVQGSGEWAIEIEDFIADLKAKMKKARYGR